MKAFFAWIAVAGLAIGAGPALAAGKKGATPPPQTTPARAFDPATGAPAGNVRLVDHKVYSSKTAGFFSLYVQTGEELPETSRWTFQVAPADRSVKVGGTPFTIAGVWANWTVDCAAKVVRPTKFVWVGPDGTMLADPAVPKSVSEPATGWTRPPGDAAVAIADQLCPEDIGAAMMGNISFGLYPVEHATALAAMRSSRAARNLAPAQRASALRCDGLFAAAQDLLGSLPLDPYQYSGTAGKLTMLSALVRESYGATRPTDAERQAAATQWQALAQRTRQGRSGKELARELNACVAALPYGLAANPFELG